MSASEAVPDNEEEDTEEAVPGKQTLKVLIIQTTLDFF